MFGLEDTPRTISIDEEIVNVSGNSDYGKFLILADGSLHGSAINFFPKNKVRTTNNLK